MDKILKKPLWIIQMLISKHYFSRKKRTKHYAGHMMNIHPSLLPDYKGLNTHQRVLDDNQTLHGASVHFVSNELDGGPVLLQASVPVYETDTAETLANRVHEKEHVIYPLAVKWFAENRIELQDEVIYLDGSELNKPRTL